MRVRGLVALAVMVLVSLPSAQAQAQGVDQVVVADATRLRGTVVVDDAEGVTIELLDGSIRKVPRSQVANVEYASTAPMGPAAGAAPTWDGTDMSNSMADTLGSPEDEGGHRLVGRVLWVSGLATFVTAYVATISVVAVRGDNDAPALAAIPVGGPFAVLAVANSNTADEGIAGLVVSGVMQPIGLVAFGVGLGVELGAPESEAEISVVPVGPGESGGVTVRGAF